MNKTSTDNAATKNIYFTMMLAPFLISFLFLSVKTYALHGKSSGEIGLKLRDIQGTQITPRLTEFNTLPKDLSLSRLNINHLCKKGHLLLAGQNIDEDDTESNLKISFLRSLIFNSSFTKTPHLLDNSNLYETNRTENSYELTLFPLNPTHIKTSYSIEDKKGKLLSNSPVGQRNKQKGIGVETNLWEINGGVSFTEKDLIANVSGNEIDTITAYVQSDTDKENFLSLKYTDSSIKPDSTNSAKEIDKKVLDFESTVNIFDKLTVNAIFLNKEVTNTTPGTVSTEDNVYLFNTGYAMGNSLLEFEFSKSSKDYSGTDIKTKDTETWAVTEDTDFSWLNINAKYSHTKVNSSGISAASLMNIEELGNDKNEKSLKVSTKGTKTFGGSYLFKTNYQKNKVIGNYGVDTLKNKFSGLSSYYIYSPQLTFASNLSLSEIAETGRVQYPANGIVDAVSGIYESSKLFNLGLDYSLTNTLSISANFSTVHSNVNDILQNNKIKERSFDIGFAKEISKDYSLNGKITINKYNDLIDSAYNGRSNIYEFETIRKF